MYIFFEIKLLPFYTENGFALRYLFLGAVKLTSNPHPDKYPYPGFGISFDMHGTFSLPNGGFDWKVITFCAGILSLSMGT